MAFYLPLAAFSVLAILRGVAAEPPRILVGTERPVSRDGDFFHVEISAASNPVNSRNAIAAAITGSRLDVGSVCRTYATTDGGETWRDCETLDQRENGGDDPQVSFGRRGTAYYSSLANRPNGNDSNLDFYRSLDGGITWERPVRVGDGSTAYDHDKIAVDRSSERFAGRIYVAALYSIPYRIGVFTSDDDGKTFSGPVDAAISSDRLGINVCRPVLLNDGALFVPFFDFPLDAPKSGISTSTFWFVLSTDGGCTFTRPVQIGRQRFNVDDPRVGEMSTDPVIAVDAQSSRYRNRLYAVWTDSRPGGSRILLTTSSDRGLHWTAPRLVDGAVPTGSRQFQPTLGVNSSGVVAVAWLDTRNSPDGSRYDEYITASVDGGAVFLGSRRLSSKSSPSRRENPTILPVAWKSRGGGSRVTLFAPEGRYEGGGDYCEMTADSEGIFHPYWPDGRSGASQVWTCPVQVVSGKREPERSRTDLVEANLDGELKLVFDPTSYDETTSELHIPVRLRNASALTIRGPIRVAIESFGSGLGDAYLDHTPDVVNAANGKRGAGAVFDFSSALGDSGGLAPGQETAAVDWILRLRDPRKTPDLHVRVTGMVEK